VTTVFTCTPSLKERLFPNPASRYIFNFDFVDNDGARVKDTGLTVYDRGELGSRERRAIERSGTIVLNPHRVVEIVDGANQRLKAVTFTYLDRSIATPFFGG
jgi:hypothetical protein